MKSLGEDEANILWRMFLDVTNTPSLAAIDTDDSLLMTTMHMLIRWPKELVDLQSPMLKKLIRVGCNQSYYKTLKEDWRGFLKINQKNLYPAEEVDPTEEEVAEMERPRAIFSSKRLRGAYDLGYYNIISQVLEEPVSIYLQDLISGPRVPLVSVDKDGQGIVLLANIA